MGALNPPVGMDETKRTNHLPTGAKYIFCSSTAKALISHSLLAMLSYFVGPAHASWGGCKEQGILLTGDARLAEAQGRIRMGSADGSPSIDFLGKHALARANILASPNRRDSSHKASTRPKSKDPLTTLLSIPPPFVFWIDFYGFAALGSIGVWHAPMGL